jgi:hypothetical protein
MALRLTGAALLAAAVVPLVGAAHAAAPNTKVCGQLTGPYVKYWSQLSGLKAAGTRWTVISTDVSCSFALRSTPGLLEQWKSAPLGGALKLGGYTCAKLIDASYDGKGRASGGGICHKGSTPASDPFGANTFIFRGTGKFTIAQIKSFFGIR